MLEGRGNNLESSGGLPQIQSSFEKPIPFCDIVKSINRLITGFYNRVSYRFPIFTSGTIVEVDVGSGSYHYFGLADSGHYIPAKIKNEGYNFQKLQAGFPVVAKGYFNLESPLAKPFMFEIRLNVIELHHIGLDKPSSAPNDFKKPAPETFKKIGLITSPNSEAVADFYKGLKKGCSLGCTYYAACLSASYSLQQVSQRFDFTRVRRARIAAPPLGVHRIPLRHILDLTMDLHAASTGPLPTGCPA